MSRRRARIVLSAGTLLALAAGLATAETSGATTPVESVVEILPPDEPWGGATRGEWNARGWQWVVSLPDGVNPDSDATGERCGWGQFGPVFFLRGGVGIAERACVVAEGTAIFVVVAGAECSTVEPPPFFGRTEDELRDCADTALDEVTDFQASVDGEEVADLNSYRTTSPLFTLTLPENNVFGVEPGVAQAVSAAYSFIIAPPPPGEYEVSWSTMYPGASEPYGSTVTVIVEAPTVIDAPPTT